MTSYRLIVVFLLWFVAMFIFAWGSSSGVRPSFAGDPSFRMLNSDELFFRNLRISEYYASTDSSGLMEILEHKDLEASVPVIPNIFINVRFGEAFLRFQGIPVTAVLGNDSIVIDPESDVTTSFHMGAELLKLLENGTEVQLCDEGRLLHTLEPGSTETKAFRKCLMDFFRLIRNGNNH
jgi:hypothetical protein